MTGTIDDLIRQAARWVGAIALALSLAGCAAQGPTLGGAQTATSALPTPATATLPATEASIAAKPVKVGLMLPLTGPGQTGLVGDAMRKAAEMTVVELNAPHLQLVVRDDKGTPEGAAAVAQEFQAAGVELVVGPLFGRSVQTAAPILRRASMPMLAFSNDRQAITPGVTLLSFLSEPEVDRVIGFAAARNKRRVIALIPDDAYGRLIEQVLRAALARHGGKLVAAETYPPEANRMLDAVKRLRDAVRGIEEHGEPVDTLFLPAGEETLVTLVPQLRQAQFDLARMQILGTGAMDYLNAGREQALIGAWFAGPDPKGFQAFSDKFARVHGYAPPRIASLTVDAIGVAAALAGGPDGARFIPGQLTRASGFSGVDGPFRLTSEGITERPLAIMEVQGVGARVLEPAPPLSGTAADRVAAGPSGLGAEPTRRVP